MIFAAEFLRLSSSSSAPLLTLVVLSQFFTLADCLGHLPLEPDPLPWCNNSTLTPGTPIGLDKAQDLLADSWLLSGNLTLSPEQQECWGKVNKRGREDAANSP